MIGYEFRLDCPTCAGQLAHVNATAGTGTQAVAVARCGACEREYAVTVHLRVLATAKQERDRVRQRGQRDRVSV